MLELVECAMQSQNITKEDLQLLAKVTYDWTKTNFQVIELNELGNVKYHSAGERFTLIININYQWNTFIKDEKNKTYIGYTDTTIKNYLEQQLKVNSFKKPHVVKINNNGISALINAIVTNDMLDSSQTVSANVKKLDTKDLRIALKQCLEMIRGINDKFTSLYNQHFKMIQRNQPLENEGVQRNEPSEKEAVQRNQFCDKKVDNLNPSSEVEAIKQAVKRVRNDMQAMETSVTPQKVSKPSPGGARASLNTDVTSLGVIIRNKEPMNYKQMEDVHDCIREDILLLEENDAAPRFLRNTFEHGGSVIITCANPESMRWLMETVPRMKPWPGAELSIRPESELRNAAIYKAYIPSKEADSVEKALYLIGKQNQGVGSEQWWVLKGTKNKNGFIVTVALNETCSKALQKIKSSVALGVTTIKFQSINVKNHSRSVTESPNKKASPKGGWEPSTFETPNKSKVAVPSVANNNQSTGPVVTSSPPGLPAGVQAGSLNLGAIPDAQMYDFFKMYQCFQRLSQGDK